MFQAYDGSDVDDLAPDNEGLDYTEVRQTIGDYLQSNDHGITSCYKLKEKPEEMEGKGTFECWVVEDLKDDRAYVVKPTLTDEERFVAMGEAAVYELADHPGLEEITVPRTRYGRFLILGDGEAGAFCTSGSAQEYIPNTGTFTKPSAAGPGYFCKDRVDFLVKNQVFDWFIGNFDSHNENFLVGKDGQYHAIDKGQAFRFLGKDELSHDYGTPKRWTPLYNDMWERYLDGRVDIDVAAAEKVISAIEAIDDREVEVILRPYAKNRERSLEKWGSTDSAHVRADEFIGAVIERKHHLREDFERFYQEMHELREEQGQAKGGA